MTLTRALTHPIRRPRLRKSHRIVRLPKRSQANLYPIVNGVIYCRVSSKEQIEGTSLESQEAACREYARSKGIQVLRTFVEQGESAKFADRTQLLELIDFCGKKKRGVEALLVW